MLVVSEVCSESGSKYHLCVVKYNIDIILRKRSYHILEIIVMNS